MARHRCQWTPVERAEYIQRCVVTAQQMQAIESRVFDAGMPVAALMDKVAGLVAQRIRARYPLGHYPRVGLVVGPGHNGGDALVVARELHEAGYEVARCQPLENLKDLTAAHSRYADHLGIPVSDAVEALNGCDLVVDGLFGFGLTRPLEGAIAHAVDYLNDSGIPIVSIDLPSGLDTDTGSILGTAVRATQTLCLGVWKRSLLMDSALPSVGEASLVDFGLPHPDIQAVLGADPACQRITAQVALEALPLPRAAATHKYREGHLLLVCGSGHYMGAAILAARSARASGVGMLSVAVPSALKPLIVSQVPDALVIGCDETEEGAIAHLPDSIDLSRYDALACGPGLTPQARPVVQHLLNAPLPLLLDADGLNILAQMDAVSTLKDRAQPTVLTPHPGEFKRLFPEWGDELGDRLSACQRAAQHTGSTIVLKGAKTVIAHGDGRIWVNADSTPALARGGTGDVLTGLLGGLMAQAVARQHSLHGVVCTAVWWHAQGAIARAQQYGDLSVDASSLLEALPSVLQHPILERYKD